VIATVASKICTEIYLSLAILVDFSPVLPAFFACCFPINIVQNFLLMKLMVLYLHTEYQYYAVELASVLL